MNLWGKIYAFLNRPVTCFECGEEPAGVVWKSGGHSFCSEEHYDDYQAERVI